jgi:hypothetical protein
VSSSPVNERVKLSAISGNIEAFHASHSATMRS